MERIHKVWIRGNLRSPKSWDRSTGCLQQKIKYRWGPRILVQTVPGTLFASSAWPTLRNSYGKHVGTPERAGRNWSVTNAVMSFADGRAGIL